MYIAKRKDRLLTHIGLYVDDDMVIHFGSKTRNMFANDQEIQFCSFQEFSHGRKVFLTKITESIEVDTLFERAAKIRDSQRKYHLLRNNCISFVLMCLHDSEDTSVIEMLWAMIQYRIQPLAFLLH